MLQTPGLLKESRIPGLTPPLSTLGHCMHVQRKKTEHFSSQNQSRTSLASIPPFLHNSRDDLSFGREHGGTCDRFVGDHVIAFRFVSKTVYTTSTNALCRMREVTLFLYCSMSSSSLLTAIMHRTTCFIARRHLYSCSESIATSPVHLKLQCAHGRVCEE